MDARTKWRPGLWLHSNPLPNNLPPVTWAPARRASCLTAPVWWLDSRLVLRTRYCRSHHRSLTETSHPIVGKVFPLRSKISLRGALRLWDSGFYPKWLTHEHLKNIRTRQWFSSPELCASRVPGANGSRFPAMGA